MRAGGRKVKENKKKEKMRKKKKRKRSGATLGETNEGLGV